MIGHLEHSFDRLDDRIGMDVMNHVTGVRQNPQLRAGNIIVQAYRMPFIVDRLILVPRDDDDRHTDVAVMRTGSLSPLAKRRAVLGAGTYLRWSQSKACRELGERRRYRVRAEQRPHRRPARQSAQHRANSIADHRADGRCDIEDGNSRVQTTVRVVIA